MAAASRIVVVVVQLVLVLSLLLSLACALPGESASWRWLREKKQQQRNAIKRGDSGITLPECPVHPQPVPQAVINARLMPTELREALLKLEHSIQEQLAEQNISACSVGVVYDKELIWSKGFGFTTPGDATSRLVLGVAIPHHATCNIRELFFLIFSWCAINSSGVLQEGGHSHTVQDWFSQQVLDRHCTVQGSWCWQAGPWWSCSSNALILPLSSLPISNVDSSLKEICARILSSITIQEQSRPHMENFGQPDQVLLAHILPFLLQSDCTHTQPSFTLLMEKWCYGSGLSGATPCDFFSIWEPILGTQCDITNEEAWKRINNQKVTYPHHPPTTSNPRIPQTATVHYPPKKQTQ